MGAKVVIPGRYCAPVTDGSAGQRYRPGDRLATVPEQWAAAVLSFSRLRKPALVVVDTHHLRVAQRLGLVPAKSTLDKGAYPLQSYLPDDGGGQRVYDYKRPACGECVVREYYDYYAERTGGAAGAA